MAYAFGIMAAAVAAHRGPAFSPFVYGAGKAAGLDNWFKDAKLGMFVHWGPVSQWGTEISFPLVCEKFPCSPAGPNNSRVSITGPAALKKHREAYAALATTFDPLQFDPVAMARLAKRAGFKYLMFTTVHCDGFVNWPSNLTNYSIANTPWGRKGRGTFAELVPAFRAEGLKVGAYVCPSLWNSDSYWAPSALTATGPVCRPNYDPAVEPERWSEYTRLLHGLVAELVALFAPDAFWFDCSNEPPATDTHLEAVLRTIRSANPDAVVNIRNGMFSDYHETNDQSERDADVILATQQEFAGDFFEVPAVLQRSHQWAYDPRSSQKSPAEVLANLVLLAAKNGNYLINVAPGPDGLWPAAAVDVLEALSVWFAANGEAVFNTRPLWPFQRGGIFTTASTTEDAIYVIIPSVNPDQVKAPVPTGAEHPSGPSSGGLANTKYQDLTRGAPLVLPWLRPSLVGQHLTSVTLLGSPTRTVPHTLNDSVGLVIESAGATPASGFDCKVFGCDCGRAASYYDIVGCNSSNMGHCGFGCAPPAAQHWWTSNGCHVDVPTPGPHAGCSLGIVFKLNFGSSVPFHDPRPANGSWIFAVLTPSQWTGSVVGYLVPRKGSGESTESFVARTAPSVPGALSMSVLSATTKSATGNPDAILASYSGHPVDVYISHGQTLWPCSTADGSLLGPLPFSSDANVRINATYVDGGSGHYFSCSPLQ